MSGEPQTRYATSGEFQIAYQVAGEGPIDLVFVGPFASPFEHWWEEREPAAFLTRLGSFSRLILFDKRGTGLSDRLANDQAPTLEERMDDVRAVMDAVGSERAALFGASEGGPMNILFAATYPHRTHSLVLYGTYARIMSAGSDYPWRLSSPMSLGEEEAIIESWGTAERYLEFFAPSAAGDERVRRWAARDERLGATPRAAAMLARMVEAIDVRHVLGAITVPTLVTHLSDDRLVPIAMGRYLADHIPGALFKEYPGQDHVLWWGEYDEMLDDIEEFLTGTRQDHQPDRVLTTVLFTDIVDSTTHAAMLGDTQWRHLLGQHHTMVEADVLAFRGQIVKSTGDGVLATFDGPARAIRCASALRDHARRLGLEVRAGLHTGEIERTGDDIAGIAVHIAARIAALATANEVLVSGAVPPLVAGSDLAFVDRGDHELKGVPGIWKVLVAI